VPGDEPIKGVASEAKLGCVGDDSVDTRIVHGPTGVAPYRFERAMRQEAPAARFCEDLELDQDDRGEKQAAAEAGEWGGTAVPNQDK
jgi:hypothetical protein